MYMPPERPRSHRPPPGQPASQHNRLIDADAPAPPPPHLSPPRTGRVTDQLRGAYHLLSPLLAAPPLAHDNAPRRPSSAPRRGNRFVSRGPTWPSHANRRTTGRGASDAPDDNAQTADPSLAPCASVGLFAAARPAARR